MCSCAAAHPDITEPTVWLGLLSPQNFIALAALGVALVALIHTVSARPIALIDVRKAYRKENEQWVVHGDLLDVFNVGRRPLPVRAVGAVTPGGVLSRPQQPFDFLGERFENPSTPLVLQPGEKVTFAFPKGWAHAERPRGSGYRLEWIKGRRLGQRVKVAKVTMKAERLP